MGSVYAWAMGSLVRREPRVQDVGAMKNNQASEPPGGACCAKASRKL